MMSSSYEEKYLKSKERNLATLLKPFWQGSLMFEESLFFAEKNVGKSPTASLLFLPEDIDSIKSANGEIVFEEGKDFSVDKKIGIIQLLPNSKIPNKKLVEMYPAKDSNLPKYGHKRGSPDTFLIFGEGHFFHDLQVTITYTHKENNWLGYIPAFSALNLPNTFEILKAKEPLTICLSGDSISAGANASGYTKAAPFMPAYGELVAKGLENKFGSKVIFHNFAVGGWKSSNGVCDAEKLALLKPNLVIIAYGMNDSGGVSPEIYAANIKSIMNKILVASPMAEFILVASMLPNVEWHYPNIDRFFEYREALLKLCGKGVVLADLTSLWLELLKRKSFHDVTGNGVNHPNDFGHRIYAQVILSLFSEYND